MCTAPIVLLNEAEAPRFQSRIQKKKCSGMCQNCKPGPSVAQPAKNDAGPSPEPNPQPVSSDEMAGIEFEKKHRRLAWTGCFHDTPDF